MIGHILAPNSTICTGWITITEPDALHSHILQSKQYQLLKSITSLFSHGSLSNAVECSGNGSIVKDTLEGTVDCSSIPPPHISSLKLTDFSIVLQHPTNVITSPFPPDMTYDMNTCNYKIIFSKVTELTSSSPSGI